MSRRALSIIVGLVGFAAAGCSFVLLLVAGSLMADARTDTVTGPGVDVFVRTPYVRAGDMLVIDVEARGGSRAGIEDVEVLSRGRSIEHEHGHGANWGSTITDGHDRGSETVTLHLFPSADDGDGLPLELRVRYVVASSSASTFTNDPHSDTVKLTVPLYDDTGRLLARGTSLAIALATFLIWFGLVWGVAKLYYRAGVREPHAKGGEMEGIALTMGVLGGGIAGYWLFAWRAMKVLETQSTFIAALLVIGWLVAPMWWSWRWTKRQRAATRLPRATLHRS